MLCRSPPKGPGSPEKPWGTPVNGERGRERGRRLWSAGTWGSPAPSRSEVRQLQHSTLVRPSRQDRTWPPAVAQRPSAHGHGAGGAPRGAGESLDPPSLALFINTVHYCMWPPPAFINRLYTCKDCSSLPAAPFRGGSVPGLGETLWSRSSEDPVSKSSWEYSPAGMEHWSRELGLCPPPRHLCGTRRYFQTCNRSPEMEAQL